MKKTFLLSAVLTLVMLVSAFTVSAQSAVKWTSSVEMTSKTDGIITITGTIDKGFHVYGFNQSPDGPQSTSVAMSTPKSIEYTSNLNYSKPVSTMDDMFGCEVTYWENKVTLTRRFKITDKKAKSILVNCDVTFMACNDTSCQPPRTEAITVKIK